MGTSKKDAALKENFPQSIAKETEVHSIEKAMTKETPKDAAKGAEQEPQRDAETEGLGREGAESPCGTKRTGEPPKGQRKNNKADNTEGEADVTLTEEDLDKIANFIATTSEDQWTALEDQQKATMGDFQSGLQVL